ncbi:MAG: type IV toxin-antitoxin system AbiEi family antitoxin domain-containing protein [Dermatophilaceae bacterium]
MAQQAVPLVIEIHHRCSLPVMDSVERKVMMDTARLPELLRYDDLAAHGLTRYGLDRLIASGEFERIAPGQFLRAGLADGTTAALMAVAAMVSASGEN